MKILLLLLFFCGLGVSAFADDMLFKKRGATIAEIEPEHQLVSFVLDPLYRGGKSSRCQLSVEGDIVFRRDRYSRKSPASFADLHVGQHVLVSGNSSASTLRAFEVLIVEPGAR